MEGGNINNSN